MPEELVETIVEVGGAVVEAGVDLAIGTTGKSKAGRYFLGFIIVVAVVLVCLWLFV
jgi:hypothetical protein